MVEPLYHVQIGGIFEILVDEVALARITLSCHFTILLKKQFYETLETQSRCSTLDKSVKSAGSRIAIVVDKLICNHHLHNSEIALIE